MPAEERRSLATRRSRVVRAAGDRTAVDSMSSAKPSKRWPAGVSKSIAASERCTSCPGLRNSGRYQATTEMPCACAVSTNRPMSAGRTSAVRRVEFEVSR